MILYGSKIMRKTSQKLTQELRGGDLYEYYLLGRHIVAAPGVCRGSMIVLDEELQGLGLEEAI